MFEMVFTGFFVGSLAAIVTIILFKKMPRILYQLALGHYLVTDLLFTSLGMALLPVVGLATLTGTLIYFLLFSVYLYYARRGSEVAVLRLRPPFVRRFTA